MKLTLFLFASVMAQLALRGQSMVPPAQDYVLGFRPENPEPGVAYTTQINLGASFTLECWISLDAAKPNGYIIGKTNNPSPDPITNYIIKLDVTGLRPVFAQSTGQPGSQRQIFASSNLALHTWTHLAAILDSGTMRLYVNGQQVNSGSSPGPPATSAVPFTLGHFCCSFAGAMREARVWSRALAPAELRIYATQKLTGTEAELVADWPLSEGTGNVAHDAGPQGLALVIQSGITPNSTDWIRADFSQYWDYQEFPVSNSAGLEWGSKFGTTVDTGSGLIALFTLARSATEFGPLRAFRWGSSGMADVTATVLPISDIPVSTNAYAVADFNGDGRPDVFLANQGIDLQPFPGGQSHLLIQSSDGKLVEETTTRLPLINAFTHDVAAADIDGDGDIDLFLSNITSPRPLLYINNGTGHFTETIAGLPDFITSVAPRPDAYAFTSSRFIDVNNDGFPDLVLGSEDGTGRSSNFLLLNDGHGHFTTAANALPPKFGGATWSTVGIIPADYDGDGFTDLILNMTEAYKGGLALQLLINNGNGTFHDASSQIPQNFPPRPPGQDWYWIDRVVPCDINGDGWIDFITTGGVPPRLYINQGHGVFRDVKGYLPVGFQEVLAADFDRDGKTDLFVMMQDGKSYGFARNLRAILPVAIPPVVTSVNMAGGASGIVQNGWIEIKGTNLTPLDVVATGLTWNSASEFALGKMPTQLGGASVTVNGKPAFVYYASPTQLNVLSPIDSMLGTVQIVVNSGGLAGAPFNVNMRTAAPSFPLFGVKYLVATHADYTLVGPTALSAPGYPVTPAKPDETILLYGFGFGLPSTALVNGASSQSGRLPTSPVIQIGGATAAVTFAGVISPGLYQFNVIVPSTAPDGDNPVAASYNGSTAPSGGLITVKR